MIIATAGHIDHGKTALVRALTGVDTDRLPEEKARGITIDLGYAYHRLPSGEILGFIDVPGHEKLVRNMLAGAIGVDFALLVIAADDGPMPQTLEHLAILDILGLSRGLVALTKADRVDERRIAAVQADIARILRGTVLEHAPIFPCSAVSGLGIRVIAEQLAEAADAHVAATNSGHFRLAVDRSFLLPGAGLVVTGTVHAGTVHAGDRLVLSPADIAVRVRALHTQNEAAEAGTTGQRCALNIVGPRLERDKVHRGNWLVAPPLHAPVSRFDVRLRLLAGEPRPLKSATPVHVHLGAADINGRVALLEDRVLIPGESAWAQITLDTPTGALFGDRFVIRDQSAQRTMGGGRVVDPFPPKRGGRTPERLRSLAETDRAEAGQACRALLAEAEAGLDLHRFQIARNLRDDEAAAVYSAAGVMEEQADAQRLGFSAATHETIRHDLLAAIAAYQDANPDSPGATADELLRRFAAGKRPALHAILRRMTDTGAVRRYGLLLHLPGHEVRLSVADESLWEEVRDALRAAGLDQPRVELLAERLQIDEPELRPLLEKLARIGWLRRVSKNYFLLPATVARLAEVAQQVAANAPDGHLTVGRFREAAVIGRNMTMPILEFFDKIGFTSRLHEGRQIRRPYQEIFAADIGHS